MITNFSEEHINIDGTDYTLFLNRKGIVSWENITKVSKKAQQIEDKYKDAAKLIKEDEPIEVTDETNPFDFAGSDDFDQIEEDEKLLRDVYAKFYWIALYTHHKLSVSEATELFEKALDEYGVEQLVELANLMIEKANTSQFAKKEVKKLEALNQTK